LQKHFAKARYIQLCILQINKFIFIYCALSRIIIEHVIILCNLLLS